MSQPDITAACRYALERLEHELAPTLFYHNVAHTRDDVVPAVERLAERAGVPTAELALLRTAAWFHDLGFVERRTDHERVSACIVIAVLPLFGYSSVQIDIIKRLIMATRMPQRPETLLEMLLADADLDSLGRPDFLATSMALRAELEAGGESLALEAWYTRQLQFLRQHCYFTHVARQLRDLGKQQNIQRLSQLLGS